MKPKRNKTARKMAWYWSISIPEALRHLKDRTRPGDPPPMRLTDLLRIVATVLPSPR